MKVHRLTTNQNIMSGIHTDFWKTIQMTTENYLLPHKATANWWMHAFPTHICEPHLLTPDKSVMQYEEERVSPRWLQILIFCTVSLHLTHKSSTIGVDDASAMRRRRRGAPQRQQQLALLVSHVTIAISRAAAASLVSITTDGRIEWPRPCPRARIHEYPPGIIYFTLLERFSFWFSKPNLKLNQDT